MKVYAFKDVNNLISASGGAFKAIVDTIYSNNGDVVIYGAAFTKNFDVKHIRVEQKEDTWKLCGSKYVRSDMSGIPQQVVNDLNDGHIVVFSGTPCQVASIKKIAENKNVSTDLLVLVDIICHGTVQHRVWSDYKKWIEEKEGSKLQEYNFRYHRSNWKSYSVFARFNSGKEYVNTFNLRRYTEIFYSDLALSEGCYKCPYSNSSRISDITIGDFWGIRKVIPDYPHHEEVSQVIVNTNKGKQIFDMVKNVPTYLIKECSDVDVFKYQQALNHPAYEPINVKQFWDDYDKKGFTYILSKYAGYNLSGFVKHFVKKSLGVTGVLNLIKELMKR